MADPDGTGDFLDYAVADPRVFALVETYPEAGLFSAWINSKLEPVFGLGDSNAGMEFDQYFTLAWDLLNVDLDAVSQAYDGVVEALNKTSEGLHEFGDSVLAALDEWEGEGKNAAAKYVGQVRDYVDEEAVALNHLAAGLLAYGCLVKASRENANNLMASGSAACRQKEEADDAAIFEFLIASAAAIVGAVATVATAGAGAVAALGTFAAATSTILGEGVMMAGKIDTTEWETIKQSYLDQHLQLRNDLVTALGTDIVKHATQATENMPADLDSPDGVGDPGKFQPESSPD